ncbi:MAG: thioredoxin domain-containing protein [Chloroflexi bacterium]|nr:thioredoxin domain-containing protein [Chloroflexota bacterium]
MNFYDPDPNRPGLTYDGSPTLGDAKASLMMLTFMDFKSAPSAQYATAVWPILRDKYVNMGQMRVVFKIYPTDAPRAAAAAACAANRGKFWEFHDLLFSKQAEWKEGDDAAMAGYAKSLGLDETKFTQCLNDSATQIAVDVALQFGQEIGVPAVPAVLFIDLKQGQAVANIVGAQPLADFESKIQAALNPITPTPAPTAVK